MGKGRVLGALGYFRFGDDAIDRGRDARSHREQGYDGIGDAERATLCEVVAQAIARAGAHVQHEARRGENIREIGVRERIEEFEWIALDQHEARLEAIARAGRGAVDGLQEPGRIGAFEVDRGPRGIGFGEVLLHEALGGEVVIGEVPEDIGLAALSPHDVAVSRAEPLPIQERDAPRIERARERRGVRAEGFEIPRREREEFLV